jgi:hypothetical protein
MNRPTYETPEQWKMQENVRDILSRDYEVFMTPKFYPWDYLFLENGEAIAAGEYKRRKATYQNLCNWGGLKLSYNKWESGMRFCLHTELEYWLLIGLDGYDDTTELWRAIFTIRSGPLKVGIFGRKDRNDPQDTEPCVIIPMESFFLMETMDISGSMIEA